MKIKILALIDDLVIKNALESIIKKKKFKDLEVDYVYSYNENHIEQVNFKPININEQYKNIIGKYNLIFSLCSQVFPKELVEKVKCINFHFGLLPYACGVFPIVFSIINNIPVGVTIHLMDEKIDHGDIIYQEKVDALKAYQYRDIEKECQKKLINILENNIEKLIYGNYKTYKQNEIKRRYFSMKDLNTLIDIKEGNNFKLQEFLNILKVSDLINDDIRKKFLIKTM